MEGLIAVYELTGDPDYLQKAERMAKHLIDNQLPDGSWSYDFKSQNENEISEKGTALWSLLFYKLYNFTKDPEHLKVARHALTWCLDNQYDGPDIHAHGGVVGMSRQSGVVYRKWFPLTCSYTSGFFGLAILEEMKLL
jgi:rhamnogalacturonyl hydrolase YesR